MSDSPSKVRSSWLGFAERGAWRVRSVHAALLAAALGAAGASAGCHAFSANTPGPTVSLRVKGNVPDAQVTIDDIPVGALGVVAARGVALPRGKHRITVEKAGYFPWDALVEATAEPLSLKVDLVPIPD